MSSDYNVMKSHVVEIALLEAFEIDSVHEVRGAFESLLSRVAYLEDRVREMEQR